jgi:hypothetical protein
VVSFLYGSKEIETLAAWGKRLADRSVPYRPTERLLQTRVENLMRMLSPLV